MATTSATTRLLVLGDTHLGPSTMDRMPTEVWKLARDADLIFHTGDVTDQTVLDALGELAPVTAVRGNNDRALTTLPDTIEQDIAGVGVAMIHDSGPTKGRRARLARHFPTADVVLFGHSHEPVVDAVDQGPLLLNPGSPTRRRRQPVHTVALLTIGNGQVDAEIREVGPLAN